jgi:SAM-dependent methyltransferase
MTDLPPKDTERDRARWERLARDPYYAVINHDGYRLDQAAEDARARFDASGEEDVARTVGEIRRFVDPAFHPRHAVDFGCGVGRLTIPLSRLCDQVTGVDISQAMLDEARRNGEARGAANVALRTSAEFFAERDAAGTVDFVHSYIVFQHIAPRAGLWLAEALIRRLARGGIGALHFTFARRAPLVRRLVHRLRRTVPGVNHLANLVQRRPLSEPIIPMNNYDVSRILMLLGDQGCAHVHVRLTDHGGHLGGMFIFRRDC